MVRFQIVLDELEASALSRWADTEMRDPRDQVRFVLRQVLEERGFLNASSESVSNGDPQNIENLTKEDADS